MITQLRNLADGSKFILVRTGQRYELLGREVRKNCIVLVVRLLGQFKSSSLNHKCRVQPLVKPRIRIKKEVALRC